MRINNICFYGKIRIIIPELSSNALKFSVMMYFIVLNFKYSRIISPWTVNFSKIYITLLYYVSDVLNLWHSFFMSQELFIVQWVVGSVWVQIQGVTSLNPSFAT